MSNSFPRVRRNWAVLRLLSAAVLILGQGCSSTPLEPWHTEDLTAEFTADRADDIRTFEDYIRLEDALFRHLDEEVYARVESGPEFALVAVRAAPRTRVAAALTGTAVSSCRSRRRSAVSCSCTA